jgi:hypothetical protein
MQDIVSFSFESMCSEGCGMIDGSLCAIIIFTFCYSLVVIR